MKSADSLAPRVPGLRELLDGADHVDVKTVEGGATLREFVAGMLTYQPGWIRSLYRVRFYFVRLLGMTQERVGPALTIAPADVSMTPGEPCAFFTVVLAEEDRHWVAGITESHLSAHLGVIAEPLPEGTRFHVLTIVRYRRWTGPVYFNVIRPFHHLVVRRMMAAGARPRTIAANR